MKFEPFGKNTPYFYDRGKSSRLYVPRYDVIAREVNRMKSTLAISNEKNVLFNIDTQVAFCSSEGSLYVPNSEDDINRTIEFAYRNIENIETMIFSLDTHYVYQIFHSSFWVNKDGKHPAPFTIIKYADVLNGKWLPENQYFKEYAINYVKQLEEKNKYSLCIWDYHAMMGSIDHSIVSSLFECAFFHSLIKDKPIEFVTKGENPMTENYSVFSPEINTLFNQHNDCLDVGSFNYPLFNELMSHDKIFIAGQASSHCVLATIEHLLLEIQKTDPTLVKKIYILEDCMSPVPAIPNVIDFPKIAQEGLKFFKESGMNVVKSTDF